MAVTGTQNKHLVGVLCIPHGNIDGNRALGGDQIAAVCGKLRIRFCRLHSLDDLVVAKEGDADAARACMSVLPCLAKRGGKDLITRLYGNGDGRHGTTRAVHTPIFAAGIILRIMLQHLPKVGLCTKRIGQLLQVILEICVRIALDYADGRLVAVHLQAALGFEGIGKQVVVIPGKPLGKRVGHVLGRPERIHHRHDQRAARTRFGRVHQVDLAISVPADQPDLGLYLGSLDHAQHDQRIAHRLSADLVIADLVVVDRIVYRRRGGGGIPGSLLCHLCDVVHRAVCIMRVEVIGHAVCAVRHPYPVITDGADRPDIGQRGVVAQPELRHARAAHAKVNKGFVILIRIGNAVGAIAVARCRAAHANRDNAAEFKGLGSGFGVAVVVKRQLGLKALVHGKVLLHVPFSGFCSVAAALAPEIAHVRECVVPCGNFLLQRLLASGKERLALLVFGRARLPYADRGAAVRGIDDPDLLAGLLDPFVSKTAVRADLARACLGQRVHGVTAKTLGGAVDVDGAVSTGQRAGSKHGGIFKRHGGVIRTAVVAVGGVHHAVRANDGLICIALAAAHIALPCQEDERNGRGGDRDFVKSAVNAHLCRADAGSDQLAVSKRDDRVVKRAGRHAVADLVRGRSAGVDDLHVLAPHVIAVVIAKGKKLSGLQHLDILD